MPSLRHLALALAFVSLTANAQQAMTAEQVVAKMRAAGNITPAADTVDTFKAGDPKSVVTGIATTISPTMDVLKKAVAAHDNFIITHEPTFYNHPDADTLFKTDPVYLEKLKYIHDNNLVIFRWHDGAHGVKPDETMQGWQQKAGWTTAHREGKGPLLYTSAPITLKALALKLQAVTGGRIIRIIGDPNKTFTKLAYAPGAPGEARQVGVLERDDVEVLVGGEIPEWETISYAWDASQQGRPKALILLGHYTSEEPGMDVAATWLKTILPSTKIDFIPAGEPYWLSSRPPAK
jgi:putative NIF3 family GTP cyclohydrolase 1 type 2